MDVLLLLMGLTLAAAGWLLIRDYTSFIYSAYRVKGTVVSIEPGFRPKHLSPAGERRIPAYFPVIEYIWNGERLRFTAIMDEAIVSMAIGDQVDVQVSRSRRCKGRLGHGLVLLMLLLATLGLLLVMGAIMASHPIAVSQICLASLVLAICLSIVVMYVRQQDESLIHGAGVWRRAALACISLQEPTAARHWPALLTSRRQKARILYSRIFGGSCMLLGILFILASFHPVSQGWVHEADSMSLTAKQPSSIWFSTPKTLFN